MRYIKTIEEFNPVNEELDIKRVWKDYKSFFIAIGFMAAVSNYTNIKSVLGLKLSDSEVSNIINDVRYEPEGDNKKMVDKIKKELILYIKNNDKIESSKKSSLIKDIEDIKITIAPKRFAKSIANGRDILGVHFLYVDYPSGLIKSAVVLNADFFEDGMFSDSDYDLKLATTIHELFHFIDFKLNKAPKLGYYSDSLDISTLLDMDIVSNNSEGKTKLANKIKNFLIAQREDKIGDVDKYLLKNKKVATQLEDIIYTKREYLTDPAEIFARFHSMKMWMYDNGIIESPNDNITKDQILFIINNYDLVALFNDQQIDFFELLFYMKIDFDKDLEQGSSLDGFNSMVVNYKNSDNKKRDV